MNWLTILDAPGHSMREILRSRINPCDVIVCPKDHFKMEVKGKPRTTKDLILHLQEKETMGSLIGNPVTESRYLQIRGLINQNLIKLSIRLIFQFHLTYPMHK